MNKTGQWVMSIIGLAGLAAGIIELVKWLWSLR